MDCGLNTLELDRIYRSTRHRLLGEAPRPLTIAGRVIRRRLGTGASGLVYAAHDGSLDREVAIKLVRRRAPEVGVRDEARALATLDHPNVVQVYDVGDHGEDVFIVMELVRGPTLDAWRRTEQPRLATIVDVFAQLADGLAHVHAAGLCHGDVKPGNVLVARGGRPRLVDFGLSRATGAPGTAPIGTPGYLAPELQRGGKPTPAGDQYALFVSLREVITGTRAEVPLLGVPRAIVRAIARGLADDPADRFADLRAVAVALRERPRSGSTLALVGVAAAAAIAIGAPRGREGPDCVPTSALPRSSEALDRGLAEHAGELGHGVAAAVRQRIDAWSEAWSATYTTVCRATWERGTQSEALLDTRMRCLDRARGSMQALVDAIDPADPRAVSHALAAVASMPAPAECADAEPTAAPDPELAATLSRAQALRRLGKYGDARPLVVELLASASGSPTLRAEAGLELAALDAQGADPAATIAGLHETIAAAHEVGRVDLEASAWLSLLFMQIERTRDVATARSQLADARVSVRLGGRDRDRVRLLSIEALLWKAEGDLEAARATMSDALRVAESLPQPEPTLVATILSNLGGIVAATGALPEARVLEERALALRIETLGPAHPDVAASHMNLAFQCEREHDDAGALAHYDRVLEVAEQIVGAQNPGLARVYLPRGRLLARIGERARARADLQRAIALATEGNTPSIAANAEALLADL